MNEQEFEELKIKLLTERKIKFDKETHKGVVLENEFIKRLMKSNPELFPGSCELDENSETVVKNNGELLLVRCFDIIPTDEIIPGCSIDIIEIQPSEEELIQEIIEKYIKWSNDWIYYRNSANRIRQQPEFLDTFIKSLASNYNISRFKIIPNGDISIEDEEGNIVNKPEENE